MHSFLSSADQSRGGAGDGSLVVRLARPADAAELATVAALDSARGLTGDTIVGEVDGRVVAAVSLEDGRVVADPFAPTANVVEVIRLHAAKGRPAKARSLRGRFGLVPRPLAPRFA